MDVQNIFRHRDELEMMDEDERMETLEEAGLNPDNYDEF